MNDDIPETGAVFTFGKSHFADNEPSHFFIKSDPVVAISCGDEHSAVICQNGRVFVFGANTWGQLGLGHKDVVTRPSCVKWLKPQRAMFVACGRAHTVFVTDTNAIYTVGCNDEGQLGTGDVEHHTVPQFVELEQSTPIKQVSAGSNHTAILTDDGRVFMCGSNSEGQLGLGEGTRSALKFTELKFMENIAFVECGYYHTVFITDQGAVFVTGDNENQKLGISNTATTVYVPQVLHINVPIKSACCGASHTFLLSMDESKILEFGSNEKGQLGMPRDIEHVVEPKEIDMDTMFDGFQLKLVACGAMHTAFVTDNGLLYTCGESRHNKLCLDEIDNTDNSNETPNQYTPKRVTAMNGHIVDNVACGGCHTLLTATKGSNADFTNNDFNIVNESTRSIAITELPPLQKVPAMIKAEEHGFTIEDVTNSNANGKHIENTVIGNSNEENGSIDSLEANVSGSHIVNINDLENESMHDVADLNNEIDQSSPRITTGTITAFEKMDTMVDNAERTVQDSIGIVEDTVKEKVQDTINNAKDTVQKSIDNAQDTVQESIDSVKSTLKENVEIAEEFVKKCAVVEPGLHDEVKTMLSIPEKIETANTSPSKTPILPELLHIPDISQISPGLSKHSDEKSETGQSENETIPCGSDKSSPQADKTAKTQAVMPIVRSEDHIDAQVETENEEADVVVNKMQEKGRFARIFQSIRDKENSCMGRGKVIEEQVVETVHKGIDNAEESIHKVEETVETQIRNQTNSSTCTIL